MFRARVYAAAFFENEPRTIVEAGLAGPLAKRGQALPKPGERASPSIREAIAPGRQIHYRPGVGKKFKDYYDLECARLLAGKLREVCPKFRVDAFLAELKDRLPDREFLARQDAFADALEKELPGSYAQHLALFERLLGPELTVTEGMFIHGWWLWPIGRYVERHGPEDFDRSMRFVYELTKRFTGEFAVRPLIAHAPGKALRILARWSRDQNVHVRRLASEGLRPRLPWARKSRVALDHFAAYKAILSNLKNDPERFVQRSVGNNLNDLMKEDPAKARAIIAEWRADRSSPATLWIIRHGQRGERKSGRAGIQVTASMRS